jgi:polysaccharide export outer membrane protein
VDPEGVVRLGPSYGSVSVLDLTVPEAAKVVEDHLKEILLKTEVLLTVEQTRGIQQIRGEHLVRPDGTVSLGIYGRVFVAEKTQEEAREALEQHLAKFFLKPTISVDIAGFNSHFYYIFFDGAGSGEQQIRLPFTGNETVLDAIGQVYGLPAVASKGRIWVARPTPTEEFQGQVLPVDWVGITQRGEAATNYQLLPGDRLYIAAQPLVTADTYLARAIAPIERLLGITLLGTSVVRSINTINSPIGTNGQ